MATRIDTRLGQQLLDTLAQRDFEGVRALFHDDARLRALVPSMLREEEGADAISARFAFWFGDLSEFEVLETEVDEVADRVRVRYRFGSVDPDRGPRVVEHQGYLVIEDGKIAAMNLVCTGFRHAE